jgi:cell division protein FtsW (lipid II flippase)
MQFVVAAASVLVFLYSLVILRQPLLGTAIALQLVFLYLVWRFVRAHERIADAKEGD